VFGYTRRGRKRHKRGRGRAVFARRGRGRAFNRQVDVDVLFGARGRRRGGSFQGDVDVRVIGIDPGLSGALAVVSGQPGAFTVECVHDLPTYSETTTTGKVRRHVDPVAFAALLDEIGPVDRVVCERMIAPPAISGMSAFSMGATMATIIAVLRMAGLRGYKLVVSSVWKRALDVPADKEAARKHAIMLFASDDHWKLKKDHNRAEAALIAAYAVLSS